MPGDNALTAFEAVVACMREPGFFPRRPRDVEVRETAISLVFLAGDRAYKLKRAVRYSYLDYATVAAREHYCRAELALNRRTAPQLYEDVRPITQGTGGRLSIGGAGDVVDWVLVMRRFDQETLFDRLAERKALTPALTLELAGEIARFHAGAEIDRVGGGSDGMAETVAINARNLRAAVPDALAVRDVEQLIAATDRELARLSKLLDARRRAGKVRHCHGDLHLRNICLVDGRPTLFDCIEFNPTISNIDVLYDLAFLLMDLHTRHLDELGNAVFNRYLDLRDEADGLAALPLFLSVRAAVRAHVAAPAARQQSDEQARLRLLTEARRYLLHALDLLRPQPACLVAVGGLSGSGKSSVAYGLAPALGHAPGARVVRSDVIRKRIFNVDRTHRLPDSAYAAEVTDRVYQRMREAAADALAAGCCVVADAIHAHPAEREAIAAVARSAQVPFVGLWLGAPAEILAKRIGGRRGDASDATIPVLQRQLTYDIGAMEWVQIDAGGPLDAVIPAARAAVERALSAQPAA
jgi:aminoglycoside phosphotransferase family enzyme/predicted kinase